MIATAQTSRRPPPAEDAVHGSLPRGIWRLAWPITLSQAISTIPSLYDSFWLGRLGANAQAAAGLATSVRTTLISVLMALSAASGAVVARYVGAKDQRNADLAMLQGVILMILSSAVLGVFGYVLAEPLMRLAGADATVLPLAVRYAHVIFPGLVALELVPSIGGVLNTAGTPNIRLTMTLWVMGTQLVAQPLLTQRFGIDGAAASLVLANVVGMLWGLGALLRGRSTVRIDVHSLRIDLPMMGRIVRIALPAVVQRGAPNLATSLLIRLISSFGSEILAAWVVCGRVLTFMQVPGVGISGAASGMVGLNLGAKQVRRAEKAVQTIGRVAVGITAGLVLILLFTAPWVLGWFNLGSEALASGIVMLRWLCVGYLLQTVTLVYDYAQVGAGDTVSPMLVNLTALWLVQLPLAWILARGIGLGPRGIWASLVVGWGVQAILMVRRFRAARWQSLRL